MTSSFKQFVPSTVCLSCDGCCRFSGPDSPWRPHVASDETPAVSSQVAADRRLKTTCRHGEHQCVFFNRSDSTCQIYQTHPFECRLYPFVLVKNDEQIIVCAHRHCPYIGQMEATPVFQEYVAYLKEYFNHDEVRQFLKRNSFLAGDYSAYSNELQELFAIALE